MVTHASTLAWRIPWKEEPGRQQSTGSLRVGHNWATPCIGEGNGNPLQCSCLESPRDGGAWWAAVYGVSQSQTRLKWLSSSSSRATAHQIHSILDYSSFIHSVRHIVVEDFCDDPVVKTPCFHCKGTGLIPSQGSSGCRLVWSKNKWIKTQKL